MGQIKPRDPYPTHMPDPVQMVLAPRSRLHAVPTVAGLRSMPHAASPRPCFPQLVWDCASPAGVGTMCGTVLDQAEQSGGHTTHSWDPGPAGMGSKISVDPRPAGGDGACEAYPRPYLQDSSSMSCVLCESAQTPRQ